VENGEIPDDDMLVGPMIRNICYGNARQYLAFPETANGSNGEKRKRAAGRANGEGRSNKH
jgi:hypothetical protein